MNVNEMANILVDEFNLSEETVDLIANINGWSEKTMCDILYAMSGYNDFDQLED